MGKNENKFKKTLKTKYLVEVIRLSQLIEKIKIF